MFTGMNRQEDVQIDKRKGWLNGWGGGSIQLDTK